MSSMLASDLNNPQFVGATNPDSALQVRFHSRPIQNNFETSKQGRPIFNDVDYIEIFTPGNQLNIIDTPVRDEHKFRFPLQWSAYQNAHAGDQREMGTPVSQWPFLSGAQAEELKAIKFFTVESIANASDLQIQSIGMIGGMSPHSLRDRAKAYLQAAAGTAAFEHDATEKAKLTETVAELQKQVAALLSIQSQPTEPIKRVLTPEHLAKLAAGREAKKAARSKPVPQG